MQGFGSGPPMDKPDGKRCQQIKGLFLQQNLG
jgi:hypothetical protein